MERQDDARRRAEYYGEQPENIPGDEVCVGQDWVNRQLLAEQPAGPPTQGYSDATMLALMDPREFSTDSEQFTKQIRKLAGPGLNRSRAVDTALRRSDPPRRKGIEANLIVVASSIWQIRSGVVAGYHPHM